MERVFTGVHFGHRDSDQLVNNQIHRGTKQLPHRLELQAESCSNATTSQCVVQPAKTTSTVVWAQGHAYKPVGQWDVDVDGFIGLAQGSATRQKRVKCALLHSLDLVFRSLNDTDGPHRQEPASIKKLLKCDATWSTRNTVLGWVLDIVNKTIQLPIHRVERLHTILASIPATQRRTSTKKWQQVIGELRSMALAVPRARGLFCSLQEALRHTANDGTRVRLVCYAHAFLDYFRWLAEGLATRPIIMLEVIPSRLEDLIGGLVA
jgi:hypothetical protein